MADKFTREKRSKIMSRIRGSNTKPEMMVRSMLHAMGIRFRIHYDQLPGKPDICLPKYKTTIFIHGCYWHRHQRCDRASMPKSNQEFWQKKFDANVKRDALVLKNLKALGWKTIIIWQCELKDVKQLQRKITRRLSL